MSHRDIFVLVNSSALHNLLPLLLRLLPDGRQIGNEFIARNPRRNDTNFGSFKINLITGKWADFATDDRGGDPISLVAYLCACSQFEALKTLSEFLGVNYHD